MTKVAFAFLNLQYCMRRIFMESHLDLKPSDIIVASKMMRSKPRAIYFTSINFKGIFQTKHSFHQARIDPNLSTKEFERCGSDTEDVIYRRLSRATEFFSGERPLHMASLKLQEIYSHLSSEFFEDLTMYPGESHRIAPFLCRGITQSKSLRGFILSQLFQCIRSKNFRAFLAGVKLMANFNSLSTYDRLLIMEVEFAISGHQDHAASKKNSESFHQISSQCVHLLIHITITFGDLLIAALFLLHANDLSVETKLETIERVISALSVDDSAMKNYNHHAIFKIIAESRQECSPMIIIDAIRNMASCESPYFANLLHDMFEEKYDKDQLLIEEFTKARKALILTNLYNGNPQRAADSWIKILKVNPGFARRNVSLFRAIIEKLTNEKLIETMLIRYFPQSLYTHRDFVDCSIAYFGQREKHRQIFEHITKSLKPPLERNTLSLLLASFISQNREDASEKILQVIFKTKNGINSEDFLVIINKLLAKGQIRKCVEMCLLNDFRVSYKGAMKVLEYLLAHKNSLCVKSETTMDLYEMQKASFIQKLTRDLQKKANTRDMYRLFTITLFKHFSAHINNRATRKLYQSLHCHHHKTAAGALNVAAYDIPPEFAQFLFIDSGNRIECLQTILFQAKFDEDQLIINWCASELQNAGLLVSDIKKYFLIK